MKKRRFLAALLSLSMLVGSWSLCVMADGEGDPADPGISTDDPESGSEISTTLGELTEGVAFRKSGLNGEQTIAFTPDTTAKYSLLVSSYEFSLDVTDKYGTQVLPLKTESTVSSVVYELKLQAGKTYIFTINSIDYDHFDTFALCICKSVEKLCFGNFDVLTKRYDSKTFSFTPEESDIYVFTTDPEIFIGGTIYPSLSIRKGDMGVECSSTNILGTLTTIAFLEAGVSYDIDISCGGGYYDCFILTHLNISHDLPFLAEESSNMISFSSGSRSSWYLFTPSEDGMYVFESQGEYRPKVSIRSSNGNSYDESELNGESNDFILRELLKGGKTYYLNFSIPEAYADEVSFPVTIGRMPVCGVGEQYITSGQGDPVYCPFAAENDGYYIFSSGTDAVSVYSYFDNSYVPDNSHAYYLEKDHIMLLRHVNNGDTGSVLISIQPVTAELEIGVDNTLMKHEDGNAYATFTPDKSGMYRFTVTCESGFNRVSLYPKSGYTMDSEYHGDDYKSFSSYLIAGEPYVLDVRLYSTSPDQVKVSVESESMPTVHDGENQIVIADPDRTFVFIPYESGLYQFSNNDSRNVEVYLDGKLLSYTMYESDYNNYRIAVYDMTAGKEYTVKIDLDWFSGDTFCFNISRPSVINEEDLSIPKIGVKQYAFFTPSKTAVYGIGCEDGSVNALYYKPADSDYFSYVSSDYSTGKRYSILEKDVTYLILIEAGFGHTSDTYDLSIETERALKTGTNKDVLIENLQGFGSHYTYYSFVPEKSGLYSFRSENNGGLSVNAFIYKEFDSYDVIGRGNASDPDGNMNMTAMLEAGETYRLWMYTDQSEQDVNIDLIIEELPAGTLAGYSLCLDGSIAVNLYMTLADYVVDSDTAVLKYTRPDGTVVNYKMDEATIKTVNNNEYYVFHLPVAAKEMTVRLAVKIIDEENGIESEQYEFSVQQYAETILRDAYDNNGNVLNQEYADAVPLVKALLNYGARAQTYFGYHSGSLANNSIYLSRKDRELGSVNEASIPHFVRSDETVKLPEGVIFEGSSLSVESETSLTYYFTNTTGETLSFTNEAGQKLSSRQSGGYTLVKMTGIPAHKLDKDFRLNVKVGSGDGNSYFVTYSPIYYCYNVLSRETSETRTDALKDLMKAFYFYNQAAKDYIGEA